MKQLNRRLFGQGTLILSVVGLLPGCGRNSGEAQALAAAWVSPPPMDFDGENLPDDDFSQTKDDRADKAQSWLQNKSWCLLSDAEASDFALKPLKLRKGVSAYLVRCLTYFSPASAIEGSTGRYDVSFSHDKGVATGFAALGNGFNPLRETLVVLLPVPPTAVYGWLSMAK